MKFSTTARAERAVLRACGSGPDVGERSTTCSRRCPASRRSTLRSSQRPETLLFNGAHSEDSLVTLAPVLLDNELGWPGCQHVHRAGACARPRLVNGHRHPQRMDGEPAVPRATSCAPSGSATSCVPRSWCAGRCWGYRCMHRDDGARGFTTAEADVIRRLAPHIAHALRQAILLHRPASYRPHRPGVVLLDEEMELVDSTPETDALLPLIGHGSRQLTLPVVVTLSPPCSHL
jgi:hypothetical protein